MKKFLLSISIVCLVATPLISFACGPGPIPMASQEEIERYRELTPQQIKEESDQRAIKLQVSIESYKNKIKNPYNIFESPEPSFYNDFPTYQILRESGQYIEVLNWGGPCLKRGLYVQKWFSPILMFVFLWGGFWLARVVFRIFRRGPVSNFPNPKL